MLKETFIISWKQEDWADGFVWLCFLKRIQRLNSFLSGLVDQPQRTLPPSPHGGQLFLAHILAQQSLLNSPTLNWSAILGNPH